MKGQDLPSISEKLDFLENHLLTLTGDSEESKSSLKHRFSYLKSQIKQRWAKAHKTEEVFLKNNESWLEGTFEIPIKTHQRQGRPCKPFADSSERSKRRKTEEMRASVDPEVIVHAAQLVLQNDGQRDASKVLKEITNTPSSAHQYRKAYAHANETVPPLTPFEALKMFVEADLTRRQYEIIRATNKKHYPCYDLLLKAKQECYPPQSALRVTATCAEMDLQSLMDHTVIRLSKFLEEVLMTLDANERMSLQLYCKWGCDGSQQTRYKQTFSEDADSSDANIFISSFVPLQIVCGQEGKKIVWQNPTPSSPRYCRPIRFRYVKESTNVIKDEIKFVENAAKALITTNVNINSTEYVFRHVMKMTMVDGKVCNSATDTASTSRCYICGVTSKNFNDLSKKNVICPEALEFGLSVLHARIRLFESILHLSYKLPIKKYRERMTQEEKIIIEQRKKEIQERFRNETGLLVDMPKANFGNTNDGNTSRRFFENTKLASEITGINHELIFRFKVILETISSGLKIDAAKYDSYALETAKLYINEYGWHPMTPTLHKILIHGASIIENAFLPIGQLSEEAAEARNKHFRSYRLNFARKFSRETCNQDIYQRLLLSSDPLLSSMRHIKRTSQKPFLKETIALLMPAEPNLSAEHENLDFEAEENMSF